VTKPISPSEIAAQKREDIPEAVIAVFNRLIAKYWTGERSVVPQSVAAQEIASALDCSEDRVYRMHWLDVEPIFIEAGWVVEYDKPAYNEDYTATFTFRPK